jgi:hypothetical protein
MDENNFWLNRSGPDEKNRHSISFMDRNLPNAYGVRSRSGIREGQVRRREGRLGSGLGLVSSLENSKNFTFCVACQNIPCKND